MRASAAFSILATLAGVVALGLAVIVVGRDYIIVQPPERALGILADFQQGAYFGVVAVAFFALANVLNSRVSEE